MAKRLTAGQRRLAVRLWSRGMTWKEVARQLGCSPDAAWRSKGALPNVRGLPLTWVPAPGRLTMEDREEIAIGLARDDTFSAIAGQIGRTVSTVSREVGANGGRFRYRAGLAHRRSCARARRPKATKFFACPLLLATVTEKLEDFWSPEEIAGYLRLEFPSDPMMQVSHETIYQSLFVQSRGELRRELTRCLRSGRAHRRVRGERRSSGQIRNMVMISERPAEVADRAVPGHWERDLIIGKNSASAVGTLVERSSRYTLLPYMPEGREAEIVKEAMVKAVETLPSELFRTITWDQGKEMACHADFTIDTGIQVYFCDPHSLWQRGSNENTNGLLRQYMPKGTDLSLLSAQDLARIATSLNNRPRKTLGYLTPLTQLAKLFALTG